MSRVFWVPIELDDLDDVDLTTAAPSDGQALVYNASTSKWRPGTLAGVEVAAKATRSSSAQSIADNTVVDVAWDTEQWDTDGIVNVGGANPDELVVQTAGKYLLAAAVDYAANATSVRHVLVQVNGTTVARDTRSAAAVGVTICSVAVELDLAVSDVVTVACFQNSGGALNVGGDVETFVSLRRVAS